jgi:hypothetical protein
MEMRGRSNWARLRKFKRSSGAVSNSRVQPAKRENSSRFGNAVSEPLIVGLTALGLLVQLTGCVSKSKADARARAAFLAGQQQAAMMSRQTQLQGPSVTLIGEVRNSVVRWSADLTLAKAVIAAQYYGNTDPAEIVIQRNGKEIPCDPKQLLSGADVQLEPNDVIELRH